MNKTIIKKTNMTQSLILFLLVCICLIPAFNACSSKKVNSRRPNQLKPGTAEFYLNEGIFYLNQGDNKMAEKKLTMALSKKPDLLSAINGLGMVYMQNREFDKAVKNFRRVIQLNPKYIEAYNCLGVIFTETGKYQLAKENLLIAANSDSYRTPENAYSNLAYLEIKQKRFKAALRYIDKGIVHNKNYPPLYNWKGVVHENMGDYSKAVFCYEKALSMLTVDDVSFLINLGRTYKKMGKEEKALDILEKALSIARAPQFKEQIRAMLKDMGK